MTPTAAANAYAAISQVAPNGTGAAKPFAQTGDFAGLLKDSVSGLVDNSRAAEQAGLAAAAGKADVVDVVTAVAETEVALETLVSVRDRVIQSYEEIMRMPI
jgi:flagellar hook-basal body complex protein FliE